MNCLSPSILSADFSRLGEQIRELDEAGAQYIHIDVMDGMFVPSISFGLPVIRSIRPCTDRIFDVHLMMQQPHRLIEAFAAAGADSINIHAECDSPVGETLDAIRRLGKKAALTLKPATPAETIAEALPLCDMVLVMTVEPGFGGQRFMAEQIQKIRRLREMGYTGHIQADGGVSLENLPLLREAGLDVAVLGTALYRSADPREDISRIHALP